MNIRTLGAIGALGCGLALARAGLGADTPSIVPEARELLEREQEIVRSAERIHGRIVSTWDMKVENFPGHVNEFVVEFAVAKADKLYVKAKDISVWGDGKTLTVRSENLKQYIQRAQPPAEKLRETIEELSGGAMKTYPGEALLRSGPGEYPLEETLKSVRAFTGVRRGECDGQAGVWIVGTGFDEKNEAGTPDYPVERFISDKDNLTSQMKQDWTDMYNAIAKKKYEEDSKDDPTTEPARVIERARWLTTYTREINPVLPAETFTFKAMDGDTQVQEFVFRRPGLETQVRLLGRPVADIRGKDLDGEPVNLRDLKGKVVVLDFWATWCGPCVQGLPSMQAIYDKYKDQGLVLMGMNRDAKGKTAKVKSFLARKHITMPQFDDSGSVAADVFEALSIPCVVFIDREGIVQEIDVGYLPGKEKQTEALIVKLLKGEAVRTPEELEQFRRQVLGTK